MSAARRNRELAAELARRAIAAAERRQAEAGAPDPADLAARFRNAADGDGRLTIDQAVDAVTGSQSGPVNWLGAEYERQRQQREARLEPDEPPSKPEGSANGGEGEGDTGVYEQTEYGPMRVWSPEELNPNKETNE
jgi:hypothetical protein